jgi:hydrogenase expression/formation protein HypE
VVQKGGADQVFINTSGVGVIPSGISISGANAQPGDVVLLSGPIGDHGIAVLSAREDLGFETDLSSDVAPLNGLVQAMLAAGTVHVLRDPTRGGLATALNEIAEQSGVAIEINESAIPVRPAVAAACEMLGFDPLYVANEGKLVACVPAAAAPQILAAMRATRYGEQAVLIGQVMAGAAGQVTLRTAIGGTRLLDMLSGEMLPRIC